MFWIDASFLLSKRMEAPTLANMEEHGFYFNSNAENGKVCMCAKLLSVRQPSSGNPGGLYEGLIWLDRGNVIVGCFE